LLHAAAAEQANAFGDQARELRERRLEAAQAEGAAIEDERARLVMVALEAL
jgi:phosphohistidine phosphatase SixA